MLNLFIYYSVLGQGCVPDGHSGGGDGLQPHHQFRAPEGCQAWVHQQDHRGHHLESAQIIE